MTAVIVIRRLVLGSVWRPLLWGVGGRRQTQAKKSDRISSKVGLKFLKRQTKIDEV
jgi:hypothetical protein